MEQQMKTYQITQRVDRVAFAVATGAALIASLALVPSAFAQGQSAPPQQGQGREGGRGERMDPQQRIDRRIAKMTEQLQLNAGQQAKIRSIYNDERTQMEALRKNAGSQGLDDRQGQAPNGQRPDSARGGEGRGRGGRGGPPPEVRAIHDKTEKQIEGVLNATQLAKYRELKQQREQERAKHEGEGRPADR